MIWINWIDPRVQPPAARSMPRMNTGRRKGVHDRARKYARMPSRLLPMRSGTSRVSMKANLEMVFHFMGFDKDQGLTTPVAFEIWVYWTQLV
jgi:hypothetical protein